MRKELDEGRRKGELRPDRGDSVSIGHPVSSSLQDSEDTDYWSSLNVEGGRCEWVSGLDGVSFKSIVTGGTTSPVPWSTLTSVESVGSRQVCGHWGVVHWDNYGIPHLFRGSTRLDLRTGCLILCLFLPTTSSVVRNLGKQWSSSINLLSDEGCLPSRNVLLRTREPNVGPLP